MKYLKKLCLLLIGITLLITGCININKDKETEICLIPHSYFSYSNLEKEDEQGSG